MATDYYRNLMINVLTIHINDYLYASRNSDRFHSARAYIFINGYYSNNHFFGFDFICRFIGLDPERMRMRIKEKRERKRQ